VQNAIRVVSHLSYGQSLRAHAAVADGGIRVSLHFYHLATPNMGDDATAAVAIPANCLYLSDFRHIILLDITKGGPAQLTNLNRVPKNLPDNNRYVMDNIITEVL